jgi:ribonuclease P protein component
MAISTHTLGKSERLKSRKQINALFEQGRKLMVFPFRIIHKIEPGLKAGFTVSSRNFPRAVDRNRIKRLMREAYRQQKQSFEEKLTNQQQGAILFFIYIGRDMPAFPAVCQAIKQGLDKLEIKR